MSANTEEEFGSAHRRLRAGSAALFVVIIVIVEGAARKWLSESLATPLLALRDFLAVFTIYLSWKDGDLRRLGLIYEILLAWTGIVVAWGLLQLTVGRSSAAIFVIGLRFWLLYLWFAFAITASFSENDWQALLKVLLYSALLMVPLGLAQQASPRGSILNALPNTSEDKVFVLSGETVRASGTFSFTVGFTSYLAIIMALLIAGGGAIRTAGEKIPFFSIVAPGLLFFGVLASGSRSTIATFASLLLLRVALAVFGGRVGGRALIWSMITAPAVLIAYWILTTYFSEIVYAYVDRFVSANQAEDMSERLFATFAGESGILESFTLLGYGIGTGSNVVSLDVEGATFGLSESENGRTLLEGGVLGLIFILQKLALCAWGAIRSLRILLQAGDCLAMFLWILASTALLTWQVGGQLTINALGYLILAMAMLAVRYARKP